MWAASADAECFLKVASKRPRMRKATQPNDRPFLLALHLGKFMAQKSADCPLWAQQAQIFKFYEDIPAVTVISKI